MARGAQAVLADAVDSLAGHLAMFDEVDRLEGSTFAQAVSDAGFAATLGRLDELIRYFEANVRERAPGASAIRTHVGSHCSRPFAMPR